MSTSSFSTPPMVSQEEAETVRALVAKGSLGGGAFWFSLTESKWGGGRGRM